MAINWSILKITNGTQTVDLLGNDGISLVNWQPNIADYKGGGIISESPLSEGSGYSFGRYGNVIENMTFHVKGLSQDLTIRATQKLREMLAQAFSYGPTRWQSAPVWIEAKAANETNTRYAVIVSARMPQDGYQFGQQFLPVHGQPAMVNLTVQIERQHWLSKKPGEHDAVTGLTAYQFWGAAFEFEQVAEGAVPSLPGPTGRYFVETVGGDTLLAFDDGGGNIYRSTNGGDVWASVQSTVSIQDVLKITDKYIIASDSGSSGRMLYSTDEGATWSVLTSAVGGGFLIKLSNGTLLTNETREIYKSTDEGATWSSVVTVGLTGTPTVGFFQSAADDTVYMTIEYTIGGSDYGYIYKSTDNGATWSVRGADTDSTERMVGITSIGTVLTQSVISNEDDTAFFVDDEDVVFIAGTRSGGGTDGNLSRSFDELANTNLIQLLADGFYANNIVKSSDGELYIAGDNLFRQVDTYGHTYIFGGSSDDNRVYIGNHQKLGQLTHILFSDDGGSSFGVNQFPIREETSFYTTMASGDGVCFGIDTDIDDSSPFCSLVFNLSGVTTSTSSIPTIVWEYWNGSAWASLTVQDNTNGFQNIGVNTVHWLQPSAWATTTLDGVTGWWVRARVSGGAGTVTAPIQAAQDIYTINSAFVEVPQLQVGGDIPALAFWSLVNRSSDDSGEMHSNRVICGLRSTSRGADFVPYINLGRTATDGFLSNRVGVSVETDQTSTGVNAVTANGKDLTYNPGAVESLVTAATISITTKLADEYSGTYRAFIRCHQTAGSVGDIEMAIGTRSNSGDVLNLTEVKSIPTLDDWQLVDFGQIQIHSDNHIPGVEIGDQTEIVIKIGSNDASATADLYDLILMPVDEWSGDFQDRANTASSRVDNGERIDIDSIQYPKTRIRSFARNEASRTKANYAAITNGSAVLQANATQRLWFLFAQYGTSGDWISEPYYVHSVALNKVQRYLSARGNY